MSRSPGETDAAEARQRALSWLARREYGRVELAKKLTQHGCSDTLAARVVEALAGANLVSDERFVEARIAARRQRGYGPVHIRRDLEERGIDRELIDCWVDPVSDEWLADLRDVKQKKFGARAPATAAERARQMRFYQHRGFTMEQIRKILERNNDTSQD